MRMLRLPTFHEHLDECERCRTQPFNLCPFGAKALQREALEVVSKLAIQRPNDE